jgi:CheY-like chemotaxis protein
MRILVLDDSNERLIQFKQRLIGHVLDCVKTSRQAIDLLKEYDYDAVFLDHDLNGEAFTPSGPGTGYEVAKWIEKNQQRKPKIIYIHSFNPVGAEKMKQALPEAILAPGIWCRL